LKIQLWGLPASGTTIIVRYFHSLPDAFFLTEPLHRIFCHGKDPEAGIEEELGKVKASVVGYKECVHTPDMPWFNLMRKKPDWTTIGMVRDPVTNWGSMLGFGWGTGPGRRVENFLSFAIPFLQTVREHPVIVYERFCEDPAGEVERTSGLKSPKSVTLKLLTDSFGNPEAHRSDSVKVVPPVAIADGDRDAILGSGVMGLYESIRR